MFIFKDGKFVVVVVVSKILGVNSVGGLVGVVMCVVGFMSRFRLVWEGKEGIVIVCVFGVLYELNILVYK